MHINKQVVLIDGLPFELKSIYGMESESVRWKVTTPEAAGDEAIGSGTGTVYESKIIGDNDETFVIMQALFGGTDGSDCGLGRESGADGRQQVCLPDAIICPPRIMIIIITV